MTSADQDERGFTLVEMVISIAVLGLLSGLLAAGLSVGLRTATGTSDRMAGSTAARMLAVYLPPDVHSANDAVASATGAGITCAGVPNPRLELVGGDGFHVVYGVDVVNGDHVLQRHECTAGLSTNVIVVARNLAGLGAVVPTRIPASGVLQAASLEITGESAVDVTDAVVVTVSGQRRSL